MPRSKVDSWLIEQAGKPAEPDESANSAGSGDDAIMVTYTAADGSTQMAFRHFWAALRSLMPAVEEEFDAVIPVTDTNFDLWDMDSDVRPDGRNEHKMTRAINWSQPKSGSKRLGRILFYRDEVGTPFYVVWKN